MPLFVECGFLRALALEPGLYIDVHELMYVYTTIRIGEGEGEAAIDPFLGPCY